MGCEPFVLRSGCTLCLLESKLCIHLRPWGPWTAHLPLRALPTSYADIWLGDSPCGDIHVGIVLTVHKWSSGMLSFSHIYTPLRQVDAHWGCRWVCLHWSALFLLHLGRVPQSSACLSDSLHLPDLGDQIAFHLYQDACRHQYNGFLKGGGLVADHPIFWLERQDGHIMLHYDQLEHSVSHSHLIHTTLIHCSVRQGW